MQANCPLVCACKGSKVEIARNWKNPDTLQRKGVELYIPFRAGDQIRGTKVAVFQIGTGDLEIAEVPDYTSSSKEIKGQNAIIYAELREGLTDHDVCERFVLAIQALEGRENEADGWNTKGSTKGKGNGKEQQKRKIKGYHKSPPA